MRKNILIIALMCMVSISSHAVLVSNVASLRAALLANQDIELTTDIDLSEWTCLDICYTGTIDGTVVPDREGEVISYVEVENGVYLKNEFGNDVPYYMHRLTGLKDTFIDTFKNATVTDLIIEGAVFLAKGSQSALNGLLCLTAQSSTFKNMVFESCTVTDGNIGIEGANNIGLLAGRAIGCDIIGVNVSECTIDADGGCVGSITGNAEGCNFSSCVTDFLTSVFGDDGMNSQVGGICGFAIKNGNTPCTFTECINCALVGTGDKADQLGGIVGRSEGSTFSGCKNYGLVSQMKSRDEWESYLQRFTFATNTAADNAAILGLAYYLKIILNAYKEMDKMAILFPAEAKEMKDAVWIDSGRWGVQGAYIYLGPAIFLTAVEILWMIYEAQEPDEVGGICGSAQGGSFTTCTNYGFIRCLDAYCGGIAGYAENITLSDCLNTGNVIGDELTGGIVGALTEGGNVSYCVNTGAVHARKATVGPIYGDLQNGAAISGINFAIAPADNATTSLTDKLTAVNRQVIASGWVAKQLADAGRTAWGQTIGSDATPKPDSTLPKAGAAGNTIDPDIDCWIEVDNIDSLKTAIEDSYAWIRLTANIALGADDYSLASESFPFRGRISGGESAYGFTGLQRKTNAIIDDIEEDDQTPRGIFSYTNGALFENITISNVDFKGTIYVGSLVGKSLNSTYRSVRLTSSTLLGCSGEQCGGIVGNSTRDIFSNCVIDQSVTQIYCDGFSAGLSRVGGIAGTATQSEFLSCINNATINSDDERNGGIVGEATGCRIMDCTNFGSVVANDNVTGGIAGYAESCAFTGCMNYGVIRNLHYQANDIAAMDDELGGIVGEAHSCTIDRCSNKGACMGGDENVGGIAGYASYTDITSCLHTAFVQGDENIGAIAGYFEEGNINNCLVTGGVWTSNGNTQVTGMDMLFGNKGDNAHWLRNCLKGDTFNAGSGGRALVTSAMLGSGEVVAMLNNSLDTPAWQQDLGKDSNPVIGDLGVHHIRNMSGRYGTICVPFPMASDDKVQFYSFQSADISSTGGTIEFVPVNTIGAGIPALFRKLDDNAASVTFTSTDASVFAESPNDVDLTGNWMFKGTYSNLDNRQSGQSNQIFYVAAGEIWNATNPIAIPAYRAWFEYSGTIPSPSSISIRIAGTTSVMTLDGSGTSTGEFIDLYGRRFSSGESLTPGIYIRDGRKVIVR